jgi:hypothetical protein
MKKEIKHSLRHTQTSDPKDSVNVHNLGGLTFWDNENQILPVLWLPPPGRSLVKGLMLAFNVVLCRRFMNVEVILCTVAFRF